MKTTIVIPARRGSTRLPGKPLILIAGIPMVQRVWNLSQMVQGVARVVVATDDLEIAEKVRSFGGEAIMTPESCRNGTERTLAAVDFLQDDTDIVVNLQGDAPITPPWVIQSMIDEIQSSKADICTPAIRLTGKSLDKFLSEKKITPASGTTVVMDQNGRALYFSKSVLPFSRGSQTEVFRHIGLYAYRVNVLRKLLSLPEGALEKSERLEQLRALENGFQIQVAVVDYRGRSHASVDDREDVARVEDIIALEGELEDVYKDRVAVA